MTERALRAAVALIALLAIGWSVVLARNAVIGDAAAARLHKHPEMRATEWNRSIDQLRQAELLDPSGDWTVTRASYLVMRDRRGALRLLEGVLEDQPDYLEAWVVVASAARGLEPRLAARAVAEMKRLNPIEVRR